MLVCTSLLIDVMQKSRDHILKSLKGSRKIHSPSPRRLEKHRKGLHVNHNELFGNQPGSFSGGQFSSTTLPQHTVLIGEAMTR